MTAERVTLTQAQQAHTRHLSAARRLTKLSAKVEREIGRVATARFIAFVVGASSTFAGWYDQAWATYSAPAVVGWGVFLVAMWRHKPLYALSPRAQLSAQWHREAAARLAHEWASLPDGGEALTRGAHIERELQIFGEVSLFKWLNAAKLAGGRARLAGLLQGALAQEPASWEQEQERGARLALRQEAARELARKPLLRARVSVEAQVGSSERSDLAPLIRWAERSEAPPAWLVRLSQLALPLVVLSWSLLAVELSTELKTLWQLPFTLQLVLFGLTTSRLSALYAPLLRDVHKGLEGLSRCFERLERARFTGEGMGRWQGELLARGAPSERVARLSQLAEALAVKHSALLYGVLSIGFCWELIYAVKLWRWREAHGARVRQDLELLYDWEALSSFGGLWAEHADLSWPTLIEASPQEGEPLLRAEQLAHPLFNPTTRRANDTQLSPHELTLITGSNMSGKSSFMRSLGTNAVLSFAGAPVVAQSLALSPFRIATSVQVTDDPSQGWSRFYAEVRRIREVIELAESAEPSQPVLYLIDEMLSGTNSRERRLASRAIATRLLSAPNATGVITTHDLDLASLSEAHPGRVRCAHFSDVFDGERLIFDYQLKPGVATTTNALRVLWLEGIEVEGMEERSGAHA